MASFSCLFIISFFLSFFLENSESFRDTLTRDRSCGLDLFIDLAAINRSNWSLKRKCPSRRVREFQLLTMSLGRPLYIWKASGLREGWSIPTPGRAYSQWRAETRVGRDYQTRTGLAGGRSNEGVIVLARQDAPPHKFYSSPPEHCPSSSQRQTAGADLFAGGAERRERGKGWRYSFSISPSTDKILRAFFWLKIIFFPAPSPPERAPTPSRSRSHSRSPVHSLSLSYWSNVC